MGRYLDVYVYLDICQSIYLFIYLFPGFRREADGGREGVPPRLLLLLLLLGAAGQRVRQPGWSVDIIHIKSISSSASKSCIRMFVITEKAPTRAFSWLKVATTAFTFKTLRDYEPLDGPF